MSKKHLAIGLIGLSAFAGGVYSALAAETENQNQDNAQVRMEDRHERNNDEVRTKDNGDHSMRDRDRHENRERHESRHEHREGRDDR